MSDGSAVRTFWCGVPNAIGAFDLSALTNVEKADIAERTTRFWLGEVCMAGVLAGIIAGIVLFSLHHDIVVYVTGM